MFYLWHSNGFVDMKITLVELAIHLHKVGGAGATIALSFCGLLLPTVQTSSPVLAEESHRTSDGIWRLAVMAV